ncbi:YihY/virulence factor BrkB family protein [Marinoscillum sp. MHG1-6]|uniref:YihY/virulence factor BrkB family protein n=1 Tax=Marinoscillum sp. MHG1-6 TaxID=2959627 RepID=UPI002157DFBA|nr:YihY/virulence factor BrkB family protein [Marinoscillum sp. MHG1-6]
MTSKRHLRTRQQLHRHLSYTGWYIRLVQLLKSIHLRHGKASLYRTCVIFIDKVGDHHLFERAYGVAFNFTLSLFPSIIFMFALIPFVHTMIPSISAAETKVFLEGVLPASLWEVTESTINDTLEIRREGLISFGVLFALFLATNGVNSLMNSFNVSYKTVERRSFVKTRFIALFITLLLATAFILSILLLIVGELVIDWLLDFTNISTDFINYFVLPLRFVVIMAAFYSAIASIYYWGPAIHDKWRFFSMGSFLATLLCLATSFGFSYYITNFGTYNKLYGSIGGMIGLMVWQYLMSAILLLGFEFNASIDRAASSEVYDKEKD